MIRSPRGTQTEGKAEKVAEASATALVNLPDQPPGVRRNPVLA